MTEPRSFEYQDILRANGIDPDERENLPIRRITVEAAGTICTAIGMDPFPKTHVELIERVVQIAFNGICSLERERAAASGTAGKLQ